MSHLHQLLQSLTAAEVTFIKKSATVTENTSPKYIEVMEAIRKQDQYDEGSLLKTFRREKFVKQFSVIKHYVHEQVLNSLMLKSMNDGGEYELIAEIIRIKTLRNKGLYDEANKLLKDALSEACESEAFAEWMELLAIQRYFIINKFAAADSKTLTDNISESQRVLHLQQNLLEYQQLNGEQIFLSDRSFNLRTEESINQHNEFMTHPLISHEGSALSKRALFELLMTKVLYYNIIDNRQQFLLYSNRVFELAHGLEWFLKFDRLRLLSTYPQRMHAAMLNGQIELVSETLQLLNTFKCSNQIQEIAAFTYRVPFALVYYQSQNLPDKTLQTIESAFKSLKVFGEKLRFDALCQIVVSCMSGTLELGLYKHAIDWSLLFHQLDRGDRVDVRLIIDMMEMIAHYELGEPVLVNNLSGTIYQRALRWGEKGSFEQIFTRFFKKMSSSIAKEDIDELCRKTLQELSAIKEADIMSQNRTLMPIFETYVQSVANGIAYHKYSSNS